MSAVYVCQDELKAYEAAMQRVVEEKMRKLKAISDKKHEDIETAERAFHEALKAVATESARSPQTAFYEALKAIDEMAYEKVVATEEACKSDLAAMRQHFERLPFLRQVYHEAPDDVFELIVSKCSWGGAGSLRGGLNVFRLTNKRCKQVVESCMTMLTNLQEENGPDSLPIPGIQKCRRVIAISCKSHNLRSLEGCPDGLKVLVIGVAPHLSDLSPLASCSRMQHLEIGNAPRLSDLSPLASCSMMESLVIWGSSIADISVVSSMPLLEVFVSFKFPGQPSIKNLDPLSSCLMLKTIMLVGNGELKDLSPLLACTALETLAICRCPLITSLAPLSNLKSLKDLRCRGNHPQTFSCLLCHALGSRSFIVN